jgi:hypothetical protein
MLQRSLVLKGTAVISDIDTDKVRLGDNEFTKLKTRHDEILEDNIDSPISCQAYLHSGANAVFAATNPNGYHLLSPNGEQVMNYVGGFVNMVLSLLQPQIDSNQTNIAANNTSINNVGSRTTNLEFKVNNPTPITTILANLTSTTDLMSENAVREAINLAVSNTSGSISATQIGAGNVTDIEFSYLNGVTSDIQTQFTILSADVNNLTLASTQHNGRLYSLENLISPDASNNTCIKADPSKWMQFKKGSTVAASVSPSNEWYFDFNVTCLGNLTVNGPIYDSANYSYLSSSYITTSVTQGDIFLPTGGAVYDHVAGRQLQLRKRDDHLTEIRRNVATASSSQGVDNDDDRIATCAAIQQYVTSVCDILDEPQYLMSADLQTTYATRVLNGRTVYRAMDEFISSYTVPISNVSLLQAHYLVDGSITDADMLWLTGGHLTTAPLAGTNLRAELNTLHQGMSTTVSPFSVPSFTSYRMSTGKYGIVFDSSKRPTSQNYTIVLTMLSATSEGNPGDETHLDDYQLAYAAKSTLGFKYYVKENDDGYLNGVFRDCRVDFACFSRGECFCHGTVNHLGVKDVEPATSTPLIVTFDGVVLGAVYYGLPLTINSSFLPASWGDMDYLPAIGTTNARNNSLNTTATVVININVIAFMVRFDAHNWSDVDVDVSSWTLIQSSTGPSNTDHFLQTGNSYSTKLYNKILTAGTYTLDDTAAWYFFIPF